jgi:hypothetical protein
VKTTFFRREETTVPEQAPISSGCASVAGIRKKI